MAKHLTSLRILKMQEIHLHVDPNDRLGIRADLQTVTKSKIITKIRVKTMGPMFRKGRKCRQLSLAFGAMFPSKAPANPSRDG